MQDLSPNRFGQFLFIMGLLLLVAFFATDQMRNPQFCLFFWGAGALGLGVFLIWRNRPAQARTADRFRTVRRVAKKISEVRAVRKEKAALKKKNKRKP
jgi:lipid-A-disaccharide synthase-like uncharacterized protein